MCLILEDMGWMAKPFKPSQCGRTVHKPSSGSFAEQRSDNRTHKILTECQHLQVCTSLSLPPQPLLVNPRTWVSSLDQCGQVEGVGIVGWRPSLATRRRPWAWERAHGWPPAQPPLHVPFAGTFSPWLPGGYFYRNNYRASRIIVWAWSERHCG